MAYKISLFDTDYDCIGTGCMSLDYIRWQLEMANGDDVDVDLSSLGGSHFDAVAIYDLLKKYPGTVNTKCVSVAGSAASTVFAAGKKRTMSKYSLLMIHPASIVTSGDSKSIASDATMLEKCTGNVIAIWADVTGLDLDKVASMVNETTWLTAEEALTLGFCTDVEDYSEVEVVSNAALVLNRVSVAPTKYKQVINHILVKQPEQAQTVNNMTDQEIKDLINGNQSAIEKVWNFFKSSAKKVVTNKGELFFVGTLDKDVQVFNSAKLDTPANDDDVEVEDSGKKVKMSIKGGKVENITEEEKADEEEDDEELDAENKVPAVKNVLNSYSITPKKGESKKVMNQAIKTLVQNAATINTQNSLIVDLREKLAASNIELAKTKDEVKNEIISTFQPGGANRNASRPSGEANNESAIKKPAEGSTAAKAAAMAVKNMGNRA